MRRFLLAAALVAVAAPASAQPSRNEELHAFLQERFAEDRTNYPGTRYVAGWADLDGDGRPEALVYMMSGNYCGSGGCELFIYTPEQGSFYQHGSMSVTQLPIRALNSRSHGWRDLSVAVAGGGTPARTVLMQHNENSYGDNPTVDPARTLPREPPGTVVIDINARPRLLF